jgi:hypothetical protein
VNIGFDIFHECEGLDKGILSEEINAFSKPLVDKLKGNYWFSNYKLSKNVLTFDFGDVKEEDYVSCINELLNAIESIKFEGNLCIYDYLGGECFRPNGVYNVNSLEEYELSRISIDEVLLKFDKDSDNDHTQYWETKESPKIRPWWKLW